MNPPRLKTMNTFYITEAQWDVLTAAMATGIVLADERLANNVKDLFSQEAVAVFEQMKCLLVDMPVAPTLDECHYDLQRWVPQKPESKMGPNLGTKPHWENVSFSRDVNALETLKNKAREFSEQDGRVYRVQHVTRRTVFEVQAMATSALVKEGGAL